MEALIHKIYQSEGKPPPNVTDGITICDWNVPVKNMKPAEDADKKETVDEIEGKQKKKKEKEDGGQKSSESLTFSVFDFAGQTVYYNTHQFFLTQRSVYLLVWNVRLGAEHSGLDFWLNSIDCHAPFCPIFVVGTHVDEVKKFSLDSDKLKKRYPQIVGFFYVSSRTGHGVEALSEAVVAAALNEKYMGEKIPKCWLDLESALKELKLTKNIVDYSEIEKLAQNFGIFDKLELSQVVQFLHDLGSLMHFNNEFLRNKVIINPQYMVDLMACLVSVNNNVIENGRLRHADLGRIWAKYDPKLHPWIVKLTEKFDLTFSVPEQALNLVPCLMPEQAPRDLDWPECAVDQGAKETLVVYDFEYLPAGLFNRAQVRLYQLSSNELIWKNGSLLTKNRHRALITRHDNQIRVRVQGVQPENIIFLIHEVLEVLITESFNGVDYDFSFPCPECYAHNSISTVGMASMYSAELVRRAANRKTPFLQCRHHFHVTPLSDLHALMPTSDSGMDSYDLQLKNSVRDLKHLKQKLTFDVVIIYSVKVFVEH
jgi:leucine-rich repeat kinase 2